MSYVDTYIEEKPQYLNVICSLLTISSLNPPPDNSAIPTSGESETNVLNYPDSPSFEVLSVFVPASAGSVQTTKTPLNTAQDISP